MSVEFDGARRRFVRDAAAALTTGRLALVSAMIAQPGCTDLAAARSMPSLGGATGWLNSPPLTAEGLRGRVVLVQFCTFTCINWLRTLPYVRAWAAKYEPHGLVVLGVHTPEFGFEKDPESVRPALAGMGVRYPVALDPGYAVWGAFRNQYWPALYFVDAEGRIRHDHFGEGEYEESERRIQRLLEEAGATQVDRDLVRVDARGVELGADWNNLRTHETYVGYGRAQNFASPEDLLADARREYTAPARLYPGQWAYSGAWTVGEQGSVANEPGARIQIRFHARDLHLVMGAAEPGRRVRFRIRVDGQPPGAAHAADADAQGNGVAAERRLYTLVRQPGPIAERLFDIEFLDPGAEAFAFTFG